MALRLVDVYFSDSTSELPLSDDDYDILDQRRIALDEDQHLVRVLIEMQDTEAFLEDLQKRLKPADDYRIVVSSVDATLPRPEPEEDADEEPESPATTEEEENDRSVPRISREELYQDVNDSISVTSVYYTLVLLSTIVAAGGMLQDNVAVVIGAMVIAPLIGPNIALALGTTLGDTDLLQRASFVNIVGFVLALALSVGMGVLLPIDPSIGEIASRTTVSLGDVALALAAGAAGALSVTRGISTALIGVMVAVALLPPVVAVGVLTGAGYWTNAYGAILLTITNIVAVNLAAVVTFLAQGVRPTTWYEKKQAKQATRVAVALWVGALTILVAAILLAQPMG